MEVSGIPLDSRRHLRQVIHQARMEGWIYFEKKEEHWYVYFCQDRYEEAKYLVSKWRTDWIKNISGNPHQSTITGSLGKLSDAKPVDKLEHMKRMREALVEANKKLSAFERTTIDYLPYTDPNGKVNFMWWYESAIKSENKGSNTLDAPSEPRKNLNVAGISPLTRTL